MNGLDHFYMQQAEPERGTMLALRELIMKQDGQITHSLKYGMPFFSYRGKMFCYLWIHKKQKRPYIGFVEGNRFDEPFLIQEKRSRMKIMMIDANKDISVDMIEILLQKALNLYRSGTIKTI